MRVGILLLALNILFTPIFGQKIDVSFRTLDINHGLYFVPNTMKPFSGNAGEKFPEGKKKMMVPAPALSGTSYRMFPFGILSWLSFQFF